jgi:hypothetical protein
LFVLARLSVPLSGFVYQLQDLFLSFLHRSISSRSGCGNVGKSGGSFA